jgi:hypothetical protein
MLRFLYVVLSKQSCGSSKDQGATASVERHVPAGHLQDIVGLGKERWGNNNKRFILFNSFDACRRPSVCAFPSNGMSMLTNIYKKSRKYGAPPITTVILSARPWTTPKVCAPADRPSSLVNRSNLSRVACILSFPHKFFTNFSVDTLRMGKVYLTEHSLNRPWLICFVARASTESNSTITLMMISVIIGVGGIVVYTSRRLRKFPKHSKRSRRAS